MGRDVGLLKDTRNAVSTCILQSTPAIHVARAKKVTVSVELPGFVFFYWRNWMGIITIFASILSRLIASLHLITRLLLLLLRVLQRAREGGMRGMETSARGGGGGRLRGVWSHLS